MTIYKEFLHLKTEIIMSKNHPIKVEDIFNSIDTNKDGVLSEDEVVATLYHSGVPVTKKMVHRIFEESDLARNGVISKDEFIQFYQKQTKRLRKMFDEIDKEKKGYLYLAEFKNAIHSYDKSINDNEIARLVQRLDTNKSNTVSFENFMAYFYLIPINHIKAAFDLIIMESFDFGESLILPTELSTNENAFIIFISGGIAAIVSRTLTAPLERTKLVMQTDKLNSGFFNAIRKMLAEDGFRGLFKGNGANILKVMPENAIRMFSYDQAKKWICRNSIAPTTVERLEAGFIAGFMSQFSVYPLEVIKTRLSLSKGEYNGIFNCGYKMIRQERIPSLYKGFSVALISMVPYHMIELTTLNTIKDIYTDRIGKEPSSVILMGCGAISSMMGHCVTYPMALARTRLQNQRADMIEYTGFVDCLKKTVKSEGFRGLYKGLVANLVKGVPAVSLSCTTFHKAKELLGSSLK